MDEPSRSFRLSSSILLFLIFLLPTHLARALLQALACYSLLFHPPPPIHPIFPCFSLSLPLLFFIHSTLLYYCCCTLLPRWFSKARGMVKTKTRASKYVCVRVTKIMACCCVRLTESLVCAFELFKF